MRDVGGGGERLTTARMFLVCACFASACRFQWVSTAGRVAARLLLVGLVLYVHLFGYEGRPQNPLGMRVVSRFWRKLPHIKNGITRG